MNNHISIKYISLILLFVLTLFYVDLFSQSGVLKFEHFSTDDGLSNKHVHCILQDSYGFLWIGTDDGLNRYDGYEFIIYNHDPMDATSLSSPRISLLTEDEQGNIWIAASELNLYKRMTGTFVHYMHNPGNKYSISDNEVTSIVIDRRNPDFIWFGTGSGGLNLFDTGSQRFYPIKHDPDNINSLSGDDIKSLCQDSYGNLWIGTDRSGLNRIRLDSIPHKADGKYDVEKLNLLEFEHYLNNGNPDSTNSTARINNIYEDKNKILWVLAEDVLNYNRERNKFTTNPYFDNHDMHFHHEILEDHTGALWFGGHNRVYKLDRDSKKISDYILNSEDIRSSTNQGLCEDRAGNIWAASWDGLVRIYRSRQLFEHYYHKDDDPYSLNDNHVYSLLADHTGEVWIGTEIGISVMTKNADGTLKFLDYSGLHNIKKGTVYSMIEDSIGSIWAVIRNRLIRIDPGRKSFIEYGNKPENHNALSFQDKRNWVGNVYLLIDKDGNFWISAYRGGVSKASLEELYSKKDLNEVKFTNYFNDPENPMNPITNMIQDKLGFIWLATSGGGLISMNPAIRIFKIIKQKLQITKSPFVQSLTVVQEDKIGNIWIGTFGSGLIKFDRGSESFFHFSRKDGLPNDVIRGILEDDNGNLWISSNYGISKFNPETLTIRNFDVTDGLQGNEFKKCFFRDTLTGKMYFGGDNGFNVFDPDSIKEDNYVPPVVITKFTRISEEGNGETIIDRSISAKDNIDLNFNENIISFEFAALSFKKNSKNEYAYMLEGFTDNWIPLGTKREVTFTNLDPGHYIFKVKDSNEDGFWNINYASIKIYISPPWWSTWWAYTLYGLAFLALLAAIRQYELNRRKEKEERRILELANKRKTDELEHARRLQLSMLPGEIPSVPDIDIAVYMKTATEVGGDYYDFYKADNGTLTSVIGDATGHGMDAGMMVSVTKGLFQALASDCDIEELLNRFNSSLLSMKLQPMYMSLFILRINNSHLEVIGAGMYPSFIYKQATGDILEVESTGPSLGAFPDYNYTKKVFNLAAGDIILLLTDGFAERLNVKNEMLGNEKIKEILSKMTSATSEDIVEQFVTAGDSWGGIRPQDDDITFVVFKMK